MDIIKNKNKELVVLDFNKVMCNNYHYFSNKKFWSEINFGVVKCNLSDLSFDDASFKISSIENIGEVTSIIVEKIIQQLLSYRDKRISEVHVMFDNYSFFYYNEKTPLSEFIDAEIEKIKKSSFKTRIKNYLLKTIIYIPHEEIDKTVAISDKVDKVDEPIVDPFPIKDVNVLNSILNEYRFEDSTFFDESLVEDNDLLFNWELRCESGYHNHDGDYAEYTATFISPGGTEYTFETEMSFMGDGWELNENDL